MDYENKTREELQKDLIESQREIEVLKEQCEKNVLKKQNHRESFAYKPDFSE